MSSEIVNIEIVNISQSYASGARENWVYSETENISVCKI
jgi:hypothetical protein